MAGTTILNRNEWKTALDQLTVDRSGDRVTIEVIDPTVGPQPEVQQLPFSYINYDP